jgi:hypothetical protein
VAKIIALNKETHRNTTINRSAKYSHTQDSNIIPIVVHEFGLACAEFPILFIKNIKTNEFQAVIATGLSPGENLYTGGDQWPGIYTPAVIRDYPLRLVKVDPDSDNFVLAIDADSDLVGEGGDIRLFDDEGEQTDYTKRAAESLVTHLQNEQLTKSFIKMLEEADLLTPRNLTVRIGDEPINISGAHLIDEEKFNRLPEETFNDFRKRGLLSPIYSHMISLSQMQRLINMRIEADRHR